MGVEHKLDMDMKVMDSLGSEFGQMKFPWKN